MIAYNYNAETGFYNGEVECQKDPLASIVERKDVWLTPGDCTLVKPPEYDIQKQYCIWDGSSWHLEDIPEPVETELQEPVEAVTYKDLSEFIQEGINSTL